MPAETLLSRLLELHQRHPERTAIIMQQAGQPDDPLSYDRLLHNAAGIATILTAHAISPGEVVILVLQHDPALINSFYGAMRRRRFLHHAVSHRETLPREIPGGYRRLARHHPPRRHPHRARFPALDAADRSAQTLRARRARCLRLSHLPNLPRISPPLPGCAATRMRLPCSSIPRAPPVCKRASRCRTRLCFNQLESYRKPFA